MLNQYASVLPSGGAPGYDADGNMITDGTFSYSWDGENRLVLASNGTTVVENAYDYMGRRVGKVVDGVTNTFVYDGWAMIQEGVDGGTNRFVYGLDLSGTMRMAT